MATAEASRGRARPELPRRWAWPGLGVVLLGGLGLRLWGVQQGLPYAFNADEADHFVPRAVAMFGHDLNPHYFANPPAFTYVLHYLFAVAYGGKSGVRHAYALHPADLYTLARVAAAVLGVAALWLLYATGARLFGRAVGLLAAAIEAVAFLPVFYAHLALNDVPTLAPITLSLLGTAGVLRKGRKRDYLLAGLGLGLACASKYTAGIVIVPFAAALAARYLDGGARAGVHALIGVTLTLALALAGFLIANPYALLDYASFHAELLHQSTLSAESQGKLGAPKQGGVLYYLWSLTWGLGWIPSLAALGGALAVWRREQRLGWLLVPAPLLFLAFMGLQGRYFGRWMLPIFPILCLLAAFFVLELAGVLARWASRASSRRRTTTTPEADSHAGDGAPSATGEPASAQPASTRVPPRRPTIVLAAVLVVVLLAQGLLYSVHSGLVLSRADTRNITRAWMLANIPHGAKIVAEPISPDQWARARAVNLPPSQNPYDWNKYPSLLLRVSSSGALREGEPQLVGLEDYERTLSPALVGYYEQQGYCVIVSGSQQSGRAFADPAAVPQAIEYYRTLAARSDVIFRSSPYARGRGPVDFGFDWSFDYYPLAYDRPGPAITIYRLRGGRCAR